MMTVGKTYRFKFRRKDMVALLEDIEDFEGLLQPDYRFREERGNRFFLPIAVADRLHTEGWIVEM